jgi:hypothetical protein
MMPQSDSIEQDADGRLELASDARREQLGQTIKAKMEEREAANDDAEGRFCCPSKGLTEEQRQTRRMNSRSDSYNFVRLTRGYRGCMFFSILLVLAAAALMNALLMPENAYAVSEAIAFGVMTFLGIQLLIFWTR